MVLGEKIKDLRLTCGLTQEELADRCELSKGYISQIENDLTSPSIATLVDLLAALGTNLKEFFASEDDDEKVVYAKDEFFEKQGAGYTLDWLVPNAQKNVMEPVLISLQSESSTEDDFPHEGEEFGYVLEGEIKIVLGKKAYKCKKGQSFYFSSNKVHKIVNEKSRKAVFIWVSSPPNF